MALPALAPIPPASIRITIAPEEWEACLDSWLTAVDLYIRLPLPKLSAAITHHKAASLGFLRSFYGEYARTEEQIPHKLRHACFAFTRRICFETDIATPLIDADFLAGFCHVHARSTALSSFMAELWKQHGKVVADSMQIKKAALTTALDSGAAQSVQEDLEHLSRIILASPDIATLFVTGSDFLDALTSAYAPTTSTETRKSLTATAYLSLQSLLKIEHPNLSLLTDHLYSLKTQADSQPTSPSLLADLVTNTPLVPKLRRSANVSGGERLVKLLDTLSTYRLASIARPRRRAPKKSRMTLGGGTIPGDEMHVHRISLITQVQDLFPDLGSGFILKLLDEYDDSVEQATAHLLDDSLPPHLQSLDRSEQVPVFDTTSQAQINHLSPNSTPPLQPTAQPYIPARRNVFDNDDFDRLQISATRLHRGKKPEEADTHPPTNKAAILAALAAFDSDDDERDDTYDVEDVGGTVDNANPADGEPAPPQRTAQQQHAMDALLFQAYKSSPEIFARGTDVRRTQPRQSLKMETGMTDEAIEGWAVMLQRDGKRLRKLEMEFSGGGDFDGRQNEIAATAYRDGGTETEDSDAGPAGGRGRGGGRGGARGGRGRGNVAGPSGDANTLAAQRRKEANKGSRANHNRRDQRARKMARGGFAG
ncbi:hypothetical protein BDY17DRAFT_326215 [Neohortaea acidophila]|uniref:CUE domain-containing protein n=1 Tax=Neohortaea acidophila TaxID=245834 RepID=A0A6A6PNE9_9PEZI|nr:uncharacterized protein BDY17DRAFT_326215 [Neohortaea acidophila]KAF2481532.1 hypothetical protein BDY17DRAFT_326215 [Neohortaea acidophila]